MLGRAQCEVLSCADLKEAFHSIPLPQKQKNFVEYSHTLAVLTIDMRYSLWD